MTKDAVAKMVSQMMRKNKLKFKSRDKHNLELYAYKVMNNPNTYPDKDDKEKDECKRHAVHTMMSIMAKRNKGE